MGSSSPNRDEHKKQKLKHYVEKMDNMFQQLDHKFLGFAKATMPVEKK